MSLDTLDHVKDRLGIDAAGDDSLLEQLQASADAWVAQFCNRDFTAGSLVERFAGDTAIVQLSRFPVASVESVRVDGTRQFGPETELAASSYVVQPDLGVVQYLRGRFVYAIARWPRRPSWAEQPRVVRVAYTVPGPPADVLDAYARLIGHLYRATKTPAAAGFLNITQRTQGDSTFIFSRDQINGLALPDDVLRPLRSHRTPLI